MSDVTRFDFAVLGGGPGGQKAAIAAAKAGRSVVLVEREARMGGACVRHGTIPSKTLRETALALRSLERRTGGVLKAELREDLEVASLMTRLDEVVSGHERYIGDQLRRNDVALWHGTARFVDAHTLEVVAPNGTRRRLEAGHVVIATGSRPRTPEGIEVDHDRVLDSDSVLSMTYLPRSLIVLGAGVIASEYASIFASLGVEVTMIDKPARPMAFLDPELTGAFLESFTGAGSRFLPDRKVVTARYDGVARCQVTLDDGQVLEADTVLCALGRVANVDRLGLAEIGVKTTARGLVEVNADLVTTVPTIYAVGDVIGPPALASTAMEQGRRAVRHALDLHADPSVTAAIPFCAYTIPEITSVGLSESEAAAAHGHVLVGRARYAEIARAHVSAHGAGLLKLVVAPDGRKLLGVQAVGEGASELVHVGQMALLAGFDIDVFVEATFNFPTLAEGYRIAALDVVRQRLELRL
ncbi:MAG: sthA 2 [Labilithrix sp.]|nr:sthA 2 [Labilithrix sp.]